MDARIWNTMTLFEQLSNIDGEVNRLVDDHERFLSGAIKEDPALDYIKSIMNLIKLTFLDPKNKDKKVVERELDDEVDEIIRYLNGDYPPEYITGYWHQFTDAISR